ncbi:MAG: pantetheine-phosphate adenylyltransferase [Clostridia bacterium]|nr:pantetheine-phosphate adenylyltransferase [Clostridia bacterium]
MQMNERIAICPGSFDPITFGHIDIITRASAMFDKIIVVVMKNNNKTSSFSSEERKEFIIKSVGNLKNVEVDVYDGLLADYAKQKNACAIIKGLRAMSDFEYEFQMALTNKKLNPQVETIFLTTSAENMYLSSSMVKQIASMGGDISEFVPGSILQEISNRLKKNK